MARAERTILAALILACGTAATLATVAVAPPAPPTLHDALALLAEGQLDQAEQTALPLARQNQAHAWAIVAASRQRRGQVDDALAAYRSFLSCCDWAPGRAFALREIQRCQTAAKAPQDPSRPSEDLSADDLRDLGRVEDQVRVETSPHFVVRARNAKLARLVAQSSEKALERICNFVLAGQEYPHSIDIYVWTDAADFVAHAEDAPEWSSGSSSYRVVNNIPTRRIDLTQLDQAGRFVPALLDSILPHEMCHLVVNEFLGSSSLPLLFNEGLAMLAEYHADPGRILLAASALASDKGIALDRLVSLHRSELDDPSVFYAEAFSFMEYLHDRLEPAQFRAVLENLRDGCTVQESILRALYVPERENFLKELEDAWRDHAITSAHFLRALHDEDPNTLTDE